MTNHDKLTRAKALLELIRHEHTLIAQSQQKIDVYNKGLGDLKLSLTQSRQLLSNHLNSEPPF
ncbi:MAG: hypothetical protein MJK04_09830 [Psychrosphaera sp.]|nr:hypothetical protein [Psychrosphaera sp.]